VTREHYRPGRRRTSGRILVVQFSALSYGHGVPTPVPRFFRSSSGFRRWLATHHAKTAELWVGFHKTGSRRSGIRYAEALDEALCFGWIDGVRKSLDAERWTIRFVPRKRDSYWSAVNARRASQLIELGRMTPAGLEAFERRDVERTRRHTHARATAELAPGERKAFMAHRGAWSFHESQPPSYRRLVAWYVVSAKREETRRRRLETLIDYCARGERLPGLLPTKAKESRKG
jgi:uncharacterized protein YdeI (YjbR/CyaY-like superfamily)